MAIAVMRTGGLDEAGLARFVATGVGCFAADVATRRLL